jgi:hypothetical protein
MGSLEKDCKPICDRWHYEPIVGYSELLSSRGWANQIDKNVSWSRITVTIPNSYYEIHKEGDKTSAYEKLWNIGGCFGLYAGLSMITVVQAIFYGIDFCILVKKRRKDARGKPTVNFQTGKIKKQRLFIKKNKIRQVQVATVNSTQL